MSLSGQNNKTETLNVEGILADFFLKKFEMKSSKSEDDDYEYRKKSKHKKHKSKKSKHRRRTRSRSRSSSRSHISTREDIERTSSEEKDIKRLKKIKNIEARDNSKSSVYLPTLLTSQNTAESSGNTYPTANANTNILYGPSLDLLLSTETNIKTETDPVLSVDDKTGGISDKKIKYEANDRIETNINNLPEKVEVNKGHLDANVQETFKQEIELSNNVEKIDESKGVCTISNNVDKIVDKKDSIDVLHVNKEVTQKPKTEKVAEKKEKHFGSRSKSRSKSIEKKRSRTRSKSRTRLKSRYHSRSRSRSKSKSRYKSYRRGRSRTRERSTSRSRRRSRSRNKRRSRSRSKESRWKRKYSSRSRSKSISRQRRRTRSRSFSRERYRSKYSDRGVRSKRDNHRSRSTSRTKHGKHKSRSTSRSKYDRHRSRSTSVAKQNRRKSRSISRGKSDRHKSRSVSKGKSDRHNSRSVSRSKDGRHRSRSVSRSKHDRHRSRSASRSKHSRRRSRSASKSKHRSRSKSREHQSSKSKKESSPASKSHPQKESSPKSKSKRGSRSKSREKESDPPKEKKIDQAKILQLAQKNVLTMIEKGTLPEGLSLDQFKKDQLVSIKSGGKSVQELTDFCTELSKKENDPDPVKVETPASVNNPDKDTGFIHHPFKLKEQTVIKLNIKNAVQIPIKTHAEKFAETAKLSSQFPVSSGNQHKQKELEWVPVEPDKSKTVSKGNEAKSVVPAVSVASKPEVSAPETPNITTNIPAPAPPTSSASGIPLPSSAPLPALMPPPLPPLPPPPPPLPNMLTMGTIPNPPEYSLTNPNMAVPTPISYPVLPCTESSFSMLPSNPGINVSGPEISPVVSSASTSTFKPTKHIDISSIVTQRFKALTKLQENPNDFAAIQTLQEAQSSIQNWVESQQVPGLFTGSTNAKLLTVEELCGPKHWNYRVKRDIFARAAPVTEGKGMSLLKKMGWNPGEGLGKNKEGSLEPLVLDIKTDKKGLVSEGEGGKKGVSVAVKELQGKHPVSALMELCSKRKWKPPLYTIVQDQGPPHKKIFLFKVEVNGVEHVPATASSNKKVAKADAALVCLQAMNVFPKCV